MSRPPRLPHFDYRGCHRYFITIRCKDRGRLFTGSPVIEAVVRILKETSEACNFTVWAYCFMPDHLHLLVEGKNDSADMRRFVSQFKQRSGHWFRRTRLRGLWQASYYERVLRSDESAHAVARYVLENPVRKGMAEDCTAYPYSGSLELSGVSQLLP